MKKTPRTSSEFGRRKFIKTTAVSSLALAATSLYTFGSSSKNEKVCIGFIGLGGSGSITSHFLPLRVMNIS